MPLLLIPKYRRVLAITNSGHITHMELARHLLLPHRSPKIIKAKFHKEFQLKVCLQITCSHKELLQEECLTIQTLRCHEYLFYQYAQLADLVATQMQNSRLEIVQSGVVLDYSALQVYSVVGYLMWQIHSKMQDITAGRVIDRLG